MYLIEDDGDAVVVHACGITTDDAINLATSGTSLMGWHS
ncbi:hypothetical protein BJ987_003382 [Nocardia goodfellowii]|uniref:Uncharacterized protein n=1 Tax=Nocardia goodfellowii TaxID=882446 RepID=A0ABS4QIJ6_9NOCA|nr:hypothetical protein [Nocardia goodfellowii]